MNKKRLFILSLLLVGFFSIIVASAYISYADSGWDSDYGTNGNAYSNGNNHNSSSNSSHSSSSSNRNSDRSNNDYRERNNSSSTSSGGHYERPISEKVKWVLGLNCIFLYSVGLYFFLEHKLNPGFVIMLVIVSVIVSVVLLCKITDMLFYNIGDVGAIVTTFIIHLLFGTLSVISMRNSIESGIDEIMVFFSGFITALMFWIYVFGNVLAFLIGYCVTGLIRNMDTKNKLKPWTSRDISEAELQKYLPNETLNSLKDKLYNSFINVQIAWMNFDYDKISELCADELATSYISQLNSLKVKQGQNIMKDFHRLENNITYIKEEAGIIYISYSLRVKFKDYVISTITNRVERGNKHKKMCNDYYLHFVLYQHLIDGKLKCPNCGAMIVPNKEGICEYCHTKISFTNDKIILERKGLL